MNAFERDIDGPAVLHYGDGEYAVLKPGRYVVCAVSGRRIPLDALRYWSVPRQEPYAGAQDALSRMVQPEDGAGASSHSQPTR